MPLQRLQMVVGLLCLLSSGSSLEAQARSYHVQLTGRNTGILLVNDSRKTIEAFHVKALCGRSTATETTYDALLWPGDKAPLAFVDGQQIQPQTDVIPPRERMTMSFLLTPQPDGCIWQAHIEAVIFSDGTYSGSRVLVQSMQAWRDGLAASLQYWTDRLHASRPGNFVDFQPEAKQRSEEDLSKNLSFRSPGGQYWQGRFTVDTDVAQITPPNEHDSTSRIRFLRQLSSQMLTEWEAKLDADAAFKRLNATFPLRPAMLQPPAPSPTSSPCKPKPSK